MEQIITADCSGDSFNRELLYAVCHVIVFYVHYTLLIRPVAVQLWQNGRLCSRLAESCKKEPTQLLARY